LNTKAIVKQAAKTYDSYLQDESLISCIQKQGQWMHRVMKAYQQAGFSPEQAFQLVLLQADSFKVLD